MQLVQCLLNFSHVNFYFIYIRDSYIKLRILISFVSRLLLCCTCLCTAHQCWSYLPLFCTCSPSALRSSLYHSTFHHTFFSTVLMMHSHPYVSCHASNLSKLRLHVLSPSSSSSCSHLVVGSLCQTQLSSQPVLSWISSFVVPMALMSRLTQSIHLCFGLPRFLLPGGTISRIFLPTYSWSRVTAYPHGHLHFCHFQFLHVGACHWYCFHPVQHSWLNDHRVYISLHV